MAFKTMSKSKSIPGIHIQWPWSQMILNGKKVVETRSYPIPEKYLGNPLAIIETPGKRGKREGGVTKSQIVGIVIFEKCYKYETKNQWAKEFKKHLVTINDPNFAFHPEKAKWGWKIMKVLRLKTPTEPPAKRGITFVADCEV